ncbi:hypothetical protein MKX03_032810 [Papaver bracteatum]|nr:hypothetical protein MKX03_032810 [Papaver bracteatum]
MTTIRKFCCNDLLEITPILMDQYNEHHKSADTRTLSWYMSTIAIWSKYFLVAEAPGNRIMGFNVAKVGGNDLSKCCQIAHVAPYIQYYRSADLVRMFVENIEVTADKIDKVFYLEMLVRSANNQKINLFERLGFVCYDQGEDRLSLQKHLPRLTEYQAHMTNLVQHKLQQPVASNTGPSVPPST